MVSIISFITRKIEAASALMRPPLGKMNTRTTHAKNFDAWIEF
jgi:hypothetical protein